MKEPKARSAVSDELVVSKVVLVHFMLLIGTVMRFPGAVSFFVKFSELDARREETSAVRRVGQIRAVCGRYQVDPKEKTIRDLARICRACSKLATGRILDVEIVRVIRPRSFHSSIKIKVLLQPASDPRILMQWGSQHPTNTVARPLGKCGSGRKSNAFRKAFCEIVRIRVGEEPSCRKAASAHCTRKTFLGVLCGEHGLGSGRQDFPKDKARSSSSLYIEVVKVEPAKNFSEDCGFAGESVNVRCSR